MRELDYLICEDAVRDPAVRAVFDAAIVQVDAGTSRVDTTYPVGVVTDGQKILASALLEYRMGIGAGPAADFDAEAMWVFVEQMRQLVGWAELDYKLEQWVEVRLRDPYLANVKHEWAPTWALIPDADPSGIPEAFFVFACKIAIAELKYGPSYASIRADRIFEWVTTLGSDLPARLKKHGTGDLPAELAASRSAAVTISANDALAVVRIVVKEESADAYQAVLDHLVRLLTETDFPRSYAIEFRGPSKVYLPIKGLPKKGVHQLFAAAVAYPELHPLIERYARAAMGEYQWYQNLEDEQCAMPGTFAVLALGMASERYAPLVLDYLRQVDGEHQCVQAKFVEAYIDAHGFTPEAVAYLVTCAGNIQHLRPRKTYPALIANRDSLEALIAFRRAGATPSSIAALQASLAGEPEADYSWRAALYSIWGEQAERDGGRRVIAAAPPELRPLYEEVFA